MHELQGLAIAKDEQRLVRFQTFKNDVRVSHGFGVQCGLGARLPAALQLGLLEIDEILRFVRVRILLPREIPLRQFEQSIDVLAEIPREPEQQKVLRFRQHSNQLPESLFGHETHVLFASRAEFDYLPRHLLLADDAKRLALENLVVVARPVGDRLTSVILDLSIFQRIVNALDVRFCQVAPRLVVKPFIYVAEPMNVTVERLVTRIVQFRQLILSLELVLLELVELPDDPTVFFADFLVAEEIVLRSLELLLQPHAIQWHRSYINFTPSPANQRGQSL